MAQISILGKTKTDVTIIGSNVDIFTYYTGKLKSIVAFITDAVKNLNGVDYKENELGFVIDGYDNTDFYLNNKGELIAYSDVADDFNIEDSGMLTIYEEED